MSAADAQNAASIGCNSIVLSNHGMRQLDVMIDSGIQRGIHVLKALSMDAKAVGLGRFYLYALAAAGQFGIERALSQLQAELLRGMQLMGAGKVSELTRNNLRVR